VLDLRPNCELCDRNLPPEDPEARICSYECTFCADCVRGALENVCPNCGGGFVPRPIRPRHSWRQETGLEHDPPSSRRRYLEYSMAQVEELVARLHATAPDRR
jgi:hypothetical protein